MNIIFLCIIYIIVMTNFKELGISTLLILLIDSLYLNSISPYFKNMIVKIQKSPFQMNILGVFISYLFIVVVINYFIIQKKRSVFEAFLLGLCIYAIYEGTNYALISNWSLPIVIVDSLWGGILFAVTTYLTYFFALKLKKN